MRNYSKINFRNKIEQFGLLTPFDVLLIGGTGTGKSSTLNALFGDTVAKVGDGVDPETQQISAYRLHEHLRIHDSAGLGDGRNADLKHEKNITDELSRTIEIQGEKNGFIDLVIVILDGGSRDLGTAFRLIEKVVLKLIEPERVIVAINQADMAMKGRGWNYGIHQPERELQRFLDEKSESVQRRIYESTGLTIEKPVCFSALHGYNIKNLIDHIISCLPRERRIVQNT